MPSPRPLSPALLHALAVLVLALPPTAALAQDAAGDANGITWLDFEFPPFYIHDGPSKGLGMADQVVDRLIAGLGDLEHRRQTAAPVRILREIESGRRVCSAAYIRTPERERVMAFSIPDLVLPPNGLTVRRETLARLGPGPYSLATLLADPDRRLGIADGRSYGEGIDAVLKAFSGKPQLFVRQGEDLYQSLVQMLVRGRLDSVVGYPYEARYVASKLGLGDAIVNLPLTEAPSYTFAHVVCPKNAWGQALIARIDDLLRQERPTESYRAATERWLDPELLPAFRDAYANELLAGEGAR